MNFYEHHLGDYMRCTAHLSLLEHGVYRRLLDVYYSREAPIPDAQAERLVCARSADEREAVRAVLVEFFTQDGDGWRHSRCDAEIAKIKARAAKLAEFLGECAWREHAEFVFSRDGNACVYCGSMTRLQLDHVVPRSKGGSDDPSNLAACCAACNQSKGAKLLSEWSGRNV